MGRAGVLVAGLVLSLAAGLMGTATLATATGLGWAARSGPTDPGGRGDGGLATGSANGAALDTLPPAMLNLYVTASAGSCPGLPWQVVAAIGTVESDNGTSTAAGVQSGANFAGAEGAMQFEPATFAEYSEPVPPGGADPSSPYDATDAVWAAARMLCADGAVRGDLPGAIFAYNHSAAYVTEVWDLAVAYGMASWISR